MAKFQFPVSNLKLMSGLEQLGRKDLENIGEELEEGQNLLSWYLGNYVESLSEAGYSETRPLQRMSLRAFGRLLRLDPADRKFVCKEVGYDRRKVYDQFALADLAIQVLSLQPEYAAGLKEAYSSLKPRGPFGRSNWLYLQPHLVALGHAHQMEVGDLPDTMAEFERIWLDHLVNEYAGVKEITSDEDKSVVALASLIRTADTARLARRLQLRGLKEHAGLTLALANTIVGSLRVNPAYSYGVSCAQFTAPKSA